MSMETPKNPAKVVEGLADELGAGAWNVVMQRQDV